MAIPAEQLETWSHLGSEAQSRDTYATIKRALEAKESPYADKVFTVFLQGSYGNDTNIHTDSDVDIVITLHSCFHYEFFDSSTGDKANFKLIPAPYCYDEFKRDVLAWLQDQYQQSTKPGNKAIKIAASGARRNADVLVSTDFRNYYRYKNDSDEQHYEGICFFDRNNAKIVNYPKMHSANLTTKHQNTRQWFKPIVRIFKNMKCKLVDDGMIASDLAPSYYIDGLLYNVPNEQFGLSYQNSVLNCLNWLTAADRSDFLCANERYYLLREGSPVTWRAAKCTEFLQAASKLWNQWRA
jgi:hypothetical protein